MDVSTVRGFGKNLRPSSFTRGNGLLGFLIRVADFFRVRLETWIILAILRIEAKRSGMPAERLRNLMAQVREDPSAGVYVQTKQPVPVDSARKRMYGSMEERRQDRYQARNGPLAISDDAPLAYSFANNSERKDRFNRYVAPRNFIVETADDDSFEPVRTQ